MPTKITKIIPHRNMFEMKETVDYGPEYGESVWEHDSRYNPGVTRETFEDFLRKEGFAETTTGAFIRSIVI